MSEPRNINPCGERRSVLVQVDFAVRSVCAMTCSFLCLLAVTLTDMEHWHKPFSPIQNPVVTHTPNVGGQLTPARRVAPESGRYFGLVKADPGPIIASDQKPG
jgi:hypothetical protein